MSTSFHIHPSVSVIPTVEQFLNRTEEALLERCREAGISEAPKLHLETVKIDGTRYTSEPQAPLEIYEAYFWLTIEGLDGGCAIELHSVDQFFTKYWREVCRNRKGELDKRWLKSCLKPGYFWIIKRYMGQPGAINLLYGLASGALAKLTNGAVFSDDGAWDYKRMPMTGDEMLCDYMWPMKDEKKVPSHLNYSHYQYLRDELG